MKNFLFAFALVGLFLVSCSDDDSCSASDWVGVYEGVMDCNGSVDSVSIEIKEGSESGTIEYIVDGDSEVVDVNDCSVEVMTEDVTFDTSLTVKMELDGDKITQTTTGKVFGISIAACVVDLKRK